MHYWYVLKHSIRMCVFFSCVSFLCLYFMFLFYYLGPWNYPVQLLLRPLIGAIAAGNAVVLKPSEIVDNISQLVFKLVNKYLDNKMIRVVCGGVPETSLLLKQKFDLIFFTGMFLLFNCYRCYRILFIWWLFV